MDRTKKNEELHIFSNMAKEEKAAFNATLKKANEKLALLRATLYAAPEDRGWWIDRKTRHSKFSQ